MTKFIVCSFDSGAELRASDPYEVFRSIVLKAGKFSAFEATESDWKASRFTRLCADPTVETFDMGYPWTGVRLRQRKVSP